MDKIIKAWQIKKEHRKFISHYQCFSTGAKIFYQIRQRTLYIYCSVTDNEPSLKIDWKTNLSAVKFNHNGKIFHYGFYKAAESMFIFLSLVYNFLDFDNIIVVGYSQGGAVAPILSILLSEYYRLPIECVAFEPPNYCKSETVDNDNLTITNVVNGNDTVTKLPAWFTKCGRILRIGEPVKWYKTGIVLRYDKTQSGIRKFIDIPEHQYSSVEENLYKQVVL
jgi:hypothetical protein